MFVVQEEDGEEYLQFSCPLTELYSEVFDVPSSLLFWRVRLRQGGDGTVALENGQIISERSELWVFVVVSIGWYCFLLVDVAGQVC